MSRAQQIAAEASKAAPPVAVNASRKRLRWLDAGNRRTVLRWARPLGGAAILAVLVMRLGTGPFLDGVRRIDGWSLAAAAAIAVVTTVCSAWRWSLVARGIGVGVPLRPAVASYYRSQFLNTTLPLGVLGDVHRGVRHGRDAGDVSRGLRAVAWERFAGQGVQLVLTLFVLLLLPSPVRSAVPVLAIVIVAVTLGAVLLSRASPRAGSSRWARTLRAAASDLRNGLYARRAWPGIVLASVVVAVGHVATFLIAARVAGSTASAVKLVPLALLVLLAAAVPANVGGWGPREGVAAWTFGAAGLGASQGLATAAVFGVMVFVSSLPGAVVLIVEWLHRRRLSAHQAESHQRRPATARPEGAERG
jgi:glycosyltransferase 2 family protein